MVLQTLCQAWRFSVRLEPKPRPLFSSVLMVKKWYYIGLQRLEIASRMSNFVGPYVSGYVEKNVSMTEGLRSSSKTLSVMDSVPQTSTCILHSCILLRTKGNNTAVVTNSRRQGTVNVISSAKQSGAFALSRYFIMQCRVVSIGRLNRPTYLHMTVQKDGGEKKRFLLCTSFSTA